MVTSAHKMTLGHTTDEDGVHLTCSCGQDFNLGFGAPVEAAARTEAVHLARELIDKMISSSDPDEIAGLIEHAVDKTDRAHLVIFHLVMRAKGVSPRSLIEDGI